MKKILKVILEVFLILSVVILTLIFLVFSAKSEIVPNIYVTSESGKTATAIMGGYKWNSFSESMIVDSVLPEEYVYTNNNILLVSPGEKITFENSDSPLERYKFYQLEMKYYDDSGTEFSLANPDSSKVYADLDYLQINAPEVEGSYVYNFKLSYHNNGEVEYGLKLIVSTEPNYEIADLIKYRNTKITDSKAINEIISLLPYSKYKKGIILKHLDLYDELLINYDELGASRKDLSNNVMALFILVPQLDTITYKSSAESFSYTRSEMENIIGRSLDEYANDVELWKKEILFKEKIEDEITSRDTIYKSIITDILSVYTKEEIGKLYIDTDSFKMAEHLKISNVDGQEILEYATEYSDIVYDITYKDYKTWNCDGILISIVDMKDKISFIAESMSGESQASGDIIYENEVDFNLYKDIYICTMIVSSNGRSSLYKYEINYNNAKWNIMELQ